MEMPDREKVIKGLECCDNDECDICPYDLSCDENDLGTCRATLHRDALALLKAQEPKKPIVSGKRYGNYFEHCPSCEIMLPISSDYGKSFYCYKCGQAVKWE